MIANYQVCLAKNAKQQESMKKRIDGREEGGLYCLRRCEDGKWEHGVIDGGFTHNQNDFLRERDMQDHAEFDELKKAIEQSEREIGVKDKIAYMETRWSANEGKDTRLFL
jgi:hypothetical protein